MAQMQQMHNDFACFADPMLMPGLGNITVGDLCTLIQVKGKNPTQVVLLSFLRILPSLVCFVVVVVVIASVG